MSRVPVVTQRHEGRVNIKLSSAVGHINSKLIRIWFHVRALVEYFHLASNLYTENMLVFTFKAKC